MSLWADDILGRSDDGRDFLFYMRLKQIDLHGFKSFAKKTTLTFATPITAVVGPNGSGKSNIVEAIRFVLGEQSMKSLRGGSSADLIFSGSGRDMNRAQVGITFANHDRVFQISTLDNQQLSLDFDEIVITREIIRDGATTYAINGTTVRLKDVLEVIASVHIGASGHHIISQGEADRLLNASARERKGMLEDALGLKSYQYKITEAERKLEKTATNLQEAELVRRELQPQLKFLERQVRKIEQAAGLRLELSSSYRQYLAEVSALQLLERNYLYEEKNRLEAENRVIQDKLAVYRQDIGGNDGVSDDTALRQRESERSAMQSQLQDLERQLGKVEGMLELAESPSAANSEPVAVDEYITIPTTATKNLLADITEQLDELLANTIEVARERQSTIVVQLEGFFTEYQKAPVPILAAPGYDQAQVDTLRARHQDLRDSMAALRQEEQVIEQAIATEREALKASQRELQTRESEFFELSTQATSLQTLVSRIDVQLEQLASRQDRYQEEITEAEVLVPGVTDNLQSVEIPSSLRQYDEGAVARIKQEQENTRRQIERMKIKLEELGTVSGDEVTTEYEQLSERDSFYEREIADLEASITSLQAIKAEVLIQLETEFTSGLSLVNDQFNEFFIAMFGGGEAQLRSVAMPVRRRRGDDEDDDDSEEETEQGIEITVKLPRKRVQNLTMLSGGERSLTSIALLFALSQVKPPPFLVLDETDAALDEANSRRYGDMIEKLSEKTQLITVTHNRETMSRAQVLYGVTLDQTGGSQLLSVKFDDAAEKYAK